MSMVCTLLAAKVKNTGLNSLNVYLYRLMIPLTFPLNTFGIDFDWFPLVKSVLRLLSSFLCCTDQFSFSLGSNYVVSIECEGKSANVSMTDKP